ncbi:hypothetical protein WR25_06281 [Diploscapter pachys]|uniref:ABC transporter domain-containing protein n=1 Tax=Diploscapter pachys TaxID=2018661 RepID=A0A2A2LS20_9BILA|nr:hypothetical protein WR25_06281 [Diploscapter pachys]
MTILMAAYYFGLISTHLMALLNARVSAAIIYGTIDRVPKIDPYSPEGKRPDSIEGRVEFRNVHFRYSTRSDAKVLDGINLVVEPGELTAIVGHSGSGKSTMVGLLTRLYEQEHGDVLLDSNDIRTLNIDWLRNNIGVVQQEPILFNDTIANNLKFGNPNASIEQMIEACRTANAHDFIVKTPKVLLCGILILIEYCQGYDTLIGDELSGGQKQRIVIARTLIRNPKVLLLDEATSALDANSESLVQRKYFRYFDLVEAQLLKQEEDDEDSSSKDENFNLKSNSIKQKGSIRSNGTLGPRFSLAFDNEKHELREDDYKSSGGINEIFKNARGNYHFLVIGLIFAILRGMELPGMALTFGYAFNALQSSNEESIMTKMSHVTIIFISIGVAVVITQVISSVMFSIVSENLSIRFRVRSFHNILYQDAAFFDNPTHSPGKIITRLAVDAPNIKALVDNRALQIINGVSTLIAIVAIAFVYCWQVAIVGTAISGIIAVIMLTSIYYIKFMNIHEATSDEAGKVAIEVIENVKTIQLLTRTHEFYEKYENLIKQHKNKSLKLGIIEAINSTISQTSRYFIIPACYGLGIYLIYNEMRTSKEVFTCIYAFMVGTIAIMNCVSYYPEIVKARASAGVLFSMINRKPATGDCRDGMKIELNGNIQFDNIKFSYPLRPRNPVLRALNLSAQKGTTIALVGPSGCGKSTCISLLERFYDANAGILVSQEQIDRALEMANATSFLSKLPNNLDTEVGEKGSQLSGGQKQKIAIARALIRNPKILLLDEATSALDSESEKAVQEALDRALEGRTTIGETEDFIVKANLLFPVIAHRLSSIQNVDLIVFIENGKVRESGTHSQLMSRKGRYYNLIQKQTLVM